MPVYNIEKYIKKCILSIIGQTYENLEIILVDDGSVDNSKEICDKYAIEDKRIKVIHKKNGGLSDARNKGIECATGEFITFIDGDDWIEKDTIEMLYNQIIKSDPDIVVYGISIDYEDGKTIKKSPEDSLVLTNKEALIYLNSYKNIDVSACNKIFRRNLFDDIKFPYGKKCEDFYIMYKLFDNARKICTIKNTKYHYFQRRNSISRNDNINMDYIYASELQMKYISEKYPDLKYIGTTSYVFSCITIFNMKIVRKISVDRKNILNEMKKYQKDILSNQYLNIKKKLQFLLFVNFNHFYSLVIILKSKMR